MTQSLPVFVQPVDALLLAQQLKRKAIELGFDLVGITSARASERTQYLRQWLDDGQAGEMRYLHNRFNERADPACYAPGAVSVVCVAMNYYFPLDAIPPESAPHHGRVARYALGDDYHELIKSRLHSLADWMREVAPGAMTRAAVDTAPVMEKDLAARAGIGWIGKNACLINPRLGSWLLLGEVLTSIPLPTDEAAADHCGTCTRCLEACPTQAITAPYQLDASRCISYLTIEHRGPISESLLPHMGNWLYGCDICQDVCPHNARVPMSQTAQCVPRFPTGSLDVRDVMQWTATEYRDRLKGSAIKRVKLPILQRNAWIVQTNLTARSTGSSA